MRRGMIQSLGAFAAEGRRPCRWFQERTAGGRKTICKTMTVALARKLGIALWRLATAGEVMRPVS
ncbi:hypothetical protein ATB98_04830 [Sinorhizobium saheli]|uniref:Uncharacterized protein n=1 Tax=Sinorhizobium saheli TaxID=36856 RepID=A0A178XWQ7_SINSA|nr:hypothetical protein ATB98_04830 [Sinorhizobium saheli]